MTKIGIIGGGPSGLITAYLLEQKTPEPIEIHLFEASDRLGGKICSQRFNHVPLLYESGMAELYDYSHIRPDPLRRLVDHLGLPTIQLSGETIIFQDKLLKSYWELGEHFGSETAQSLLEFDQKAIALISPENYGQLLNPEINNHPWTSCSFQSVLEEISDPIARQLVKIGSHSDLGTEPHLTNGLYGIENWLVDNLHYMRLYAIEGGNERLPQALKNAMAAEIHLNSPVQRVAGTPEGNYQIEINHQGDIETHTFDAVIVALPVYWLPMIQWEDQHLAKAVQIHHNHYDKPAHYLRITILFQSAFWQEKLPDSYFILDAFGGCCVYDETSRYDAGGYGILSWLLSGNDALVMNNLADSILVQKALESLPSWLQPLRSPCLEAKVDRRIGAVNAQPGGFPIQPDLKRHQPAAESHPQLLMVGDYLYDSTLNGVMTSANFASDCLLKQLNFTPRPCDLNPFVADL
jgi:hypothetical protein